MESQLGMGVMIRMLSGNEDSVKAFTSALNKTISSIALEDEALVMGFDDGTKIKFFDNGQSCCESRYMRTDDDLQYYMGAKLLDATIDPGLSTDVEYGTVHEIQFLNIKTSKGVFTMSSHNEHNGYYGGFSIEVEEVKKDD